VLLCATDYGAPSSQFQHRGSMRCRGGFVRLSGAARRTCAPSQGPPGPLEDDLLWGPMSCVSTPRGPHRRLPCARLVQAPRAVDRSVDTSAGPRAAVCSRECASVPEGARAADIAAAALLQMRPAAARLQRHGCARDGECRFLSRGGHWELREERSPGRAARATPSCAGLSSGAVAVQRGCRAHEPLPRPRLPSRSGAGTWRPPAHPLREALRHVRRAPAAVRAARRAPWTTPPALRAPSSGGLRVPRRPPRRRSRASTLASPSVWTSRPFDPSARRLRGPPALLRAPPAPGEAPLRDDERRAAPPAAFTRPCARRLAPAPPRRRHPPAPPPRQQSALVRGSSASLLWQTPHRSGAPAARRAEGPSTRPPEPPPLLRPFSEGHAAMAVARGVAAAARPTTAARVCDAWPPGRGCAGGGPQRPPVDPEEKLYSIAEGGRRR